MMYGQMTAGSWIYIGTQGILHGTYETCVAAARKHYQSPTLTGKWVLTAGLGGMGGAQPLAATMNEGTCLAADIDPDRIDFRLRTKYVDVRIDDLDPPREPAGAAQAIMDSLERHGLHWDEQVLWQSNRAAAYDTALAQLRQRGVLFQCDCSRKSLGHNGECAGNCRTRQAQIAPPSATRISTRGAPLPVFDEQLQTAASANQAPLPKDFIVGRRDGLYAYQLAVVVDDAYQGITHIVRGSDLLDTTARQVHVQQALGLNTPRYCHVPVITNPQGQRFSKQHHAPALEDAMAADNLRIALRFLCQQSPPQELLSCEQILAFASPRWSLDTLPRTLAIVANH